MGKTTVIYKDIAVGASDAATVAASGQTVESVVSELPNGVDALNIIALEKNLWTLDGAFSAFYERSVVAFWSNALSGQDCAFEAEPTITITFSTQFSSMGVSLEFDESDYCSQLNIKWYQDSALKAEQDFYPDEAAYFCEKKVESYDKIVLTLNKTALPERRVKLNRIIFGVIRTFGMEELRSATITEQMNEAAIEVPISTFNWTLDSHSDVEYMFQLKQPVEVRNDGNLLGVFYIDESARAAKRVYDIECHDALGVLSEMQFPGAAYLEEVSAKTLLEALAAPFKVEYSGDVTDAALKGILAPGDRRSAIQQVIFAWGVCLATDCGESLRVFVLPSEKKTIPQSRTYDGAALETASIVTSVRVTAHTYTQDSSGDVTIGDAKYKDTKTVYTVSNPNVTASDRENIKEIQDATLVSTDIGQATAQRVYDYYEKRNTNSARIVYGGEKLGDGLNVYAPWGDIVSGNLSKMEITLSNTVAYKAEVRG